MIATKSIYGRATGRDYPHTINYLIPSPARSDIFSRCHCQGLKIRGICQSCGFVVVCKSCNRTKQADGSFKNVPHASDNISHGLCEDCAVMIYPGIAHLAIARIRAREAN